jgi:tRNA/tmRNA/rRNA uracil-C5-methylase (TrmA/RlmC/RlmD family)
MQAEVRIERYADQGRCVAHVDGRVVFVRFALPGELVRIEFDEPHDRDDRFWTAEVVEVIEASDDRVDPVWPLAGPLAMGGGVGGADLIHVSLPGQLTWKAVTVSEQMSRLGHIEVAVPIERIPGDQGRGGLGWRTRIEMIADDDGKPSMRRRGSHSRVALDTMPLATDALLEVAERERVWNGGFEPGAQIRLAAPEPRVSASRATTSRGSGAQRVGTIPRTGAERRAAAASKAGRSGAAAEKPSNNYSILVDGELKSGTTLLTEQVPINGTTFTYRVNANGFWQIHRQAPLTLGTYVINLINERLQGAPAPVIWDLYSGSGMFTLPLATMTGKRTRMLSIEGARGAVKNAQRNLRAMDLTNVDARTGDVSRILYQVPANLAKPDVVVLDPPRAGARAKVCRQIAAAKASNVIYIACDPASLARDSATLIAEGYELTSIRAFDIYPMTHHVETVALFTR